MGHTHGASNYIPLSFKAANEQLFLDFYTTYGLHVVDSDLQNKGVGKVKIIPTGVQIFTQFQNGKLKNFK